MSQKLTCHLAAIPMRVEPTDKAELVNQVLLGEEAQVLDENEKWWFVRLLHDNYEGWVDKKQMRESTGNANGQPHSVTSLFQTLADGRMAPCGAMTSEAVIDNSIDIEKTAMQFIGSPYLWGGRTFMGIDCSGFTQLVFRACGKALPRDAYQQAALGDTIAFVDEARLGDLAFFDNAEGRITHVGIVMNRSEVGQLKIIHASGEVRVDTLDHQGIYNAETKVYSHNLRLIKRV